MLGAVAIASASVLASAPAQAAEINAGGASFPAVIMSTCMSSWNALGKDTTFSAYSSTGSGTGKSNFTKGTFKFAMTDSAYTSGKPSFAWEYVPMIAGGITFPINLKGTNKKPIGNKISLSQKNLSEILAGRITKWNDPKIANAKENKGIKSLLPATAITIVYRSDNSGTSNNLLQYLNAWQPTTWTKVQDGFGTAFPGGSAPANSISGAQNTGVMTAVKGKDGAIGYVDLADALAAKAALPKIQNALGQFVAPSAQTIGLNAAKQASINGEGFVMLDYKKKVSGAYPIAIFSYALGRMDGNDTYAGVRDFARYFLKTCAPQKAAKLGFVPLSGNLYSKAYTLAGLIK